MNRFGYTVWLALFLLLLPGSLWAESRVIHVLVALCDNETQGIVPVSAQLGNGDDPAKNLYWGAMYGVSTHLRKHKDWEFKEKVLNPDERIYERLIFKSKAGDTFIVADAYAGKYIKECTEDLFKFASGQDKIPLTVAGAQVTAGGGADLLVYMGHNGLMDFQLDKFPVAYDGQKSLLDLPLEATPILSDGRKRQVAVFSCLSERFFKEALKQAGAEPLILTRDLMAPEAYILAALAEGWMKKERGEVLRDRVAAAYNAYQKCGIKAAKRTFTDGGL